jgi:hypothetical protein
MLDAARIDQIRLSMEDEPHVGSETEGILTHPIDLTVVHRIGQEQPTQAVIGWIRAQEGEVAAEAARSITPDVPETTIEANPPPMRSARSAAASQRLLSILVDSALRGLHPDGEPCPQLLHGAALRPPDITEADASDAVKTFKRLYYRFQIGVHGDKVGAAAGDHLNLSAPWLGHRSAAEITRKQIELTGRMRLVGGALGIALSASSPLFYGVTRGGARPVFATALTPWESARLGHVWPGRTIMDVSGLYRDPVRFRRTMRRFAQTGTLLSGRDVWLAARAQPGACDLGPTFEALCDELGIDLASEPGLALAEELLHASFRRGPHELDDGLGEEEDFLAVERWRQARLEALIQAPRNRTEIRTGETPPAFAADSPGGDYRTPYEYVKSVHTFVELLYVLLAENPPWAEDLEYGELELQAAKSNEQAVLLSGLAARIRWIPGAMRPMTARELLRWLLTELEPLADGLGRSGDLSIVRQIADGEAQPPAARIRGELARWYGIDAQVRHNARLLPHDGYPRDVLRRSREAMAEELDQIEADLPGVPDGDRPYLSGLVELVRRTRPSAALEPGQRPDRPGWVLPGQEELP